MLSSTYHAIVHCLPLMVIFFMHLAYGLTAEPCDFRDFVYIPHHNSADSMHQYISFSRSSYITFTPFSTCTPFLFSGFALHMMSTNSPAIFIKMKLYSGVLALRYAPGTSKVVTYIPLCASIMRLVNRDCSYMVCEDTSFLVM